jgi:transmembrane sensor
MTADRNYDIGLLTRDASRWVTQLASGEATEADAEALARWRRQSPAHEEAFSEAVHVWRSLKLGGRSFIAQQGAPTWSRRPQQIITRRALVGGAGMLAVGGAACAMLDPPLGLWPSIDELRADYRTATGEQRRVTVADVAIQMNTQTSIAIAAQGGGKECVKLISGEASFGVPAQAQLPLTVLAAAGWVVARRGRFDVRNIAAAVCVTCIDGPVEVQQGEHTALLTAGSQLTYDARGLGKSVPVDTAEATAWQSGFIVFRSAPLSAAVAEINRYRPGRVVLLNAELARTPVSGRFRIDRIEEVLAWLEEVTDAHTRSLPGGIVLLS